MTKWENISTKWTAIKPRLFALVAGLVLGPFVSNALGWQVTSGSAQAQARMGIIEQLSTICDVGARTAVADPGKLDWSTRAELAKKWAIMPGASSADSDVTNACERKLQT